MSFDEINRLLQKYAGLPIDEEGNPLDQKEEQDALKQLHVHLDPLVQQCINELSWRISRADHDVVRQTFWSLFIAYLRKERAAGRSVQITSLAFIRWKVKHAAGFRGGSRLDQLNSAMHDYLSKPPDERNWHGPRVLLALKRCCEKVVEATDPKGVPQVHTTDAVALILFDRFEEGTIWQVCITPIYAQRAEDLDSNDHDSGFQPVWNVPCYVANWDAFRAEARPLLFGGSAPSPQRTMPPPTLSVDQLLPEKYREAAKKQIKGRFSTLHDDPPLRRLQHLSCLLFLGYYEHESIFCRDFNVKGSYAHKCKGFWFEQVVLDLASARKKNEQKCLLHLYKSHKYYGQLLDCLHAYYFIACSDCARNYLHENPAVGSDELVALWGFCFHEDSSRRPAQLQFEAVDEDPPERLVAFKERYPPPQGLLVEVS